MSTRQTVPAAPGPLEEHAGPFDDLFSRANQRHAFRQYLEGLLLPVDPKFKTKLQLAIDLVDAALAATIRFRVAVADCFYGEDETVKCGLRERGVGYVLALKPSHAWWHREGDIGSPQEVAASSWEDAEHPGEWVWVVRHFRDGHTEDWWALEINAGPYGPERTQRAVIATTDLGSLPEHNTWYLVTNLPAPGSARARDEGALPAADLAEIVRLYGLRNWVEQSYKQTRHALGWSEYQVRSPPPCTLFRVES